MSSDPAASTEADLESALVEVTPLSRDRRDVLRFLRVAEGIYRRDPNWVAPLPADFQQILSDSNPLFTHAEIQLWVAIRAGRDVGRIAGVVEHHHNDRHQDSAAFFGFFECIQDSAVSGALFETVRAWARARRLQRLLGPMNPTSNAECGLLVEGFETPPTFMMAYNPKYYRDLVQAAGFRQAKDLLAYYIDTNSFPVDRLRRVAQKVRSRAGELRFRPIRKRTFYDDLEKVRTVFNAAWSENWGFVPMSEAEIRFIASRLKPLFREGLVWLAETETEPVGFLLAVPDYNLMLQPLRGRWLTLGLLRALPYFLGWKPFRRARVLTLGVRADYRGRGLESVMLFEALQIGLRSGYREAEASWILEDNFPMRRLLEAYGARPYKTYRLYEREVDGSTHGMNE